MKTPAYLILGIAGLAMNVSVIRRPTSCRYSLPCPIWLRWHVAWDNPFARTNPAAVIVGHLGIAYTMHFEKPFDG